MDWTADNDYDVTYYWAVLGTRGKSNDVITQWPNFLLPGATPNPPMNGRLTHG